MEPIRILFLTAAPTDLPRAKVEAEFKHIEGELDDRFDCRFVPAVGRADLLRQLLKLTPHVVHFSGHGSEYDELILESPTGGSEPVSAEELERIFALVPAQQRPKIVVLSACYSKIQAEAVTRVVDCAVGMTQVIHDTSAFAFAQGFYLAIGRGLPIDQAVEAGRLAMPGDQAIRELPSLHVREGAELTTAHLVGAGPISRFPPELHIDRSAQLDRFRGMLDTGEPRILVVTADGNMGKSRLMKAMAQEAKAHPVASTDLTRSAGSPEEVLRRLVSGLGAARADERTMRRPMTAPSAESVQADPSAAAARHARLTDLTLDVVEAAEAAAVKTGNRTVFLLDGFDEGQGEIASWVEDTLVPEVLRSKRVVCVIAGRAEPTLDSALQWVGTERLENFGENDVREVLELLRLNASAAVARTTWITTESGHPYLTFQTIEKLWRDAVSSR